MEHGLRSYSTTSLCATVCDVHINVHSHHVPHVPTCSILKSFAHIKMYQKISYNKLVSYR